MDSALVSAQLGLLTTVISTVIGGMAALGLASLRPRSAVLLGGILSAPLMVPGIVAGIAMLFYFTRLHLGATFVACCWRTSC